MADRLYLSLWFPSFEEAEMIPRTLAVLKHFPFSNSQPGIRYLGIYAISWNEPLVFEQTFDSRETPEQAVELAREHVHRDHAYEFEAMWDLWSPEIGGGLDTTWRLQPQPVKFLVHGTEFEDGLFQEDGHVKIDFGLDTPFLANIEPQHMHQQGMVDTGLGGATSGRARQVYGSLSRQ
ncbi:MAG: hypothetical protein DMG63_19665 [Acidobacteria bacterium]|nr:MAG: hypothetical protein DMG63_19665 [Acidobacteriota bacterium]